jgi:hypothetical protein
MKGCPYCDMMQNEWNSFKQSDTIDTIDVNYELMNELNKRNDQLFKPVNSYPTIYSNVNNFQYEGTRNKDSFLEFSKSIKEMYQKSANKNVVKSPTKAKKAKKYTKENEEEKAKKYMKDMKENEEEKAKKDMKEEKEKKDKKE